MNLETLQSVLAGAAAVLLVVSALLALVRIIRGPSVLDRTVAMEVMIAIMIAGFGLEAAVSRSTVTLPVLAVLALVGFVGSVTIARFVARDHDRGSDTPSQEADPTSGGRDAPDHHAGPSGSQGAGSASGEEPDRRSFHV